MPWLFAITSLLGITARFASLAVLLGTVVNVIGGALIVFSSINLYANLNRLKTLHTALLGPLQGSWAPTWYRWANHFLPLTEVIELTALMFSTAGTVLLIRVLWRVKSSTSAKNPLTGV